MLEKCIKSINDDRKDIIISFKASTKRLQEQELRQINKGEEALFIRGNVEVQSLISYNFGFPIYKTYYKEKNVSFGRFKKEIVDKIPNDFMIGDLEVFPSY